MDHVPIVPYKIKIVRLVKEMFVLNAREDIIYILIQAIIINFNAFHVQISIKIVKIANLTFLVI